MEVPAYGEKGRSLTADRVEILEEIERAARQDIGTTSYGDIPAGKEKQAIAAFRRQMAIIGPKRGMNPRNLAFNAK